MRTLLFCLVNLIYNTMIDFEFDDFEFQLESLSLVELSVATVFSFLQNLVGQSIFNQF